MYMKKNIRFEDEKNMNNAQFYFVYLFANSNAKF